MPTPSKQPLPTSFGFREFGEALLGKHFYPKQAAVLDALTRPAGGPVSLVACNEAGKALALDTPIPTPAGWSTMGNLKVGDTVYAPDGRECRVTLATPVMHGHPCYRVTFSDGNSIVADGDHLWETDYCEPFKRRPHKQCTHRVTMTTEQIKATLRYCIGLKWSGAAHSIPVCLPIDSPPAMLAMPPYLLGVWLGDGTSLSSEITCHADEVAHFAFEFHLEGFTTHTREDKRSKARTLCFTLGKSGRESISTAILRAIGVFGNKHIPESYLRGREVDRYALLQGLMDTDGYCDKRGQCEYVSMNRRLADGVLELALSLGFKAVMRTGRARCEGKDCGEKYRVCFVADSTKDVFRLRRKVVRLPEPKAEGSERPTNKRFIVAIDAAPSVPVKCIQVDSPTHCFLAGRGFIKTHNTKEIITTAVLGALVLFKAKVITTSGSYSQIKDQLDPSLKAYEGRFPQYNFQDCAIRTSDPNCFWHGISTNDPGKMEGHHDEKDRTGKVVRPLLIIVDEAKTVKDPIYEAIERCKPTWLLLASSAGYSQGEFFRSHTSRAAYYQRFKQTADDCPHWTADAKQKIRQKWGPEHPLVKSMLDAEFMPFVEGAVVNLAALDDLLADPPPFQPGPRKYFCDFAWSESGTGDQNVCAKREGNRITVPLKFRAKGLHAVCARFIQFWMSEIPAVKPWEIEGDADGDGANIIKQLRNMGWAIGSAHNGGAPRWNDHYANLASEMWCEGAMSIIKRAFILPDDLEFYAQALNRKIVPGNKGKMCIESKLAMKDPNREGGSVPESPDVADACFGCMSPMPMSNQARVMGGDEPVASTKDSTFAEWRTDEPVQEQPIPGAWWG